MWYCGLHSAVIDHEQTLTAPVFTVVNPYECDELYRFSSSMDLTKEGCWGWATSHVLLLLASSYMRALALPLTGTVCPDSQAHVSSHLPKPNYSAAT